VFLFGTWDSQGGGGVNTAKVARSLVSEIIAMDAVLGVRTSSRIDPLGIKAVQGVIAKVEGAEKWKYVEQGEAGKKAKKGEGNVRPSEINHGNVLPTITDAEKGAGGITCREAVQTTVLSLTQLRKLRFPAVDGVESAERDVLGRAVIAALGLVAVTLQQEDGYQLRSRCQLVPVATPQFEAIGRTAKERETFELDSAAAGAALELALESAAAAGLQWHSGSIALTPRPDLVKLVAYSDSTIGGGAGGE
jgi:CRISPR-associated protein Csb1